MTLGIFTDDYFPFIGGMGRYVHELSKRLPREKVLIFSPADNEIQNHVQVKPACHSMLRNLSYSFWLYRHIHRIAEQHRLSKINIQCGPGGLFLFTSPGIPAIATCHHTWWQQSHYIFSQFWKRAFIPFEKRTYRLVDKIICDAEDSKRILVERYEIPSDKIAVVPIGVDRDVFFPIEKVEKVPFSLLFVGRLDKRKGIDFLLKVMTRVVLKIPQARLYIGGTGKNRVKLRKFIKNNDLTANVVFTGFIPDDQLNFWYNRVQCVVVPSVFEGFGLTVIEAMAAGTPVVATDVDALREIIDNNVDGYLVKYGDELSLREQIVTLLSDAKKRDEFRGKGLEKIKTFYNWDDIHKRFMDEVGIFL